MSGDTLDQQQLEQQHQSAKSAQESAQNEGKESSSLAKRSLFSHLNSDLQQALNSWEVLTEQMAHKISPEEEQLSEVKRLLGELKSKLKEFGE